MRLHLSRLLLFVILLARVHAEPARLALAGRISWIASIADAALRVLLRSSYDAPLHCHFGGGFTFGQSCGG